jgi:hypothetical protein
LNVLINYGGKIQTRQLLKQHHHSNVRIVALLMAKYTNYSHLDEHLDDLDDEKLTAWKIVEACNFFGKNKAPNYAELVKLMLADVQNAKCFMSLKFNIFAFLSELLSTKSGRWRLIRRTLSPGHCHIGTVISGVPLRWKSAAGH